MLLLVLFMPVRASLFRVDGVSTGCCGMGCSWANDDAKALTRLEWDVGHGMELHSLLSLYCWSVYSVFLHRREWDVELLHRPVWDVELFHRPMWDVQLIPPAVRGPHRASLFR